MDVSLSCGTEHKPDSAERKPRKIAVIGGGIAGLSAAWSLEKARRAGEPVSYALYEASSHLGGVIRSEIVDGCVVEGGPDSFLTEKPAAAELCRQLGIADQLLGSNDAERKTYILVGNRLIPLPDGLMFMVPTKLVPTALTPLFSWRTKLRMAREFLFPPRPAREDESVAAMTCRHFGQETVDRLVSPLLSGVYGGDASDLSVRAVLPRMVSMEQKHRSLSRAMLAARTNAIPPGKSHAPRSLFTTLRNGMSQMTDALARELQPGSIHLHTPVRSLRHNSDFCPELKPGCKLTCGWAIQRDDGPACFDAVILALPAWSSGRLLRPVDRLLSEMLEEIPYSSSITVTLGFSMDQLRSLPPGFGYLVPATERRTMLACTFVHTKFAGRTPPDKGVLRCFLGGAGNDALLDESDERITEKVLTELAEILHISGRPGFVRITRSRQAMAQYAVGHLDRMQFIRDSVATIPGLALAGNAYEGIGVPDCIRTGQHAAHTVLKALQQASVATGH
jgi:oxygen-dependent protoporphyrinogen oxidase